MDKITCKCDDNPLVGDLKNDMAIIFYPNKK